METKAKNGFVGQLWAGWVSLDPAQRNKISERLGPVGHCLSIAANVHSIAASAQAQGSTAETPNSPEEDDDIIDVDYEECDT